MMPFARALQDRKCSPSISGMTYFGRCQRTLTAPFTALAPINTATLHNPGPVLSFQTVWDTTTGSILYRSETILSAGTLFAEPVTIIWQSSDLSKFPSAYATALAATMGVELQATLIRTESSTKPTSGLTVGAKVGVALGALCFALLVGATIIFCLQKRRKTKQPVVSTHELVHVSEMSGYSSGLRRLFRGKWRAEVDGRAQRMELEAEKVYELPVPPAELEAPQHQQQQREAQNPGPPYEIRPHSVSTTQKKEGTVSMSEAVKRASD